MAPLRTEQEASIWLAQQFAKRLGQALEGMTGSPSPCDARLLDAASRDSEIAALPAEAWIEYPMHPPAVGSTWIGCPPESAAAIGLGLLQAAGLTAEDASPAETAREFFGQIGSGITQELTPQLGQEVTLSGAQPGSVPPATAPILAAVMPLDGKPCRLTVAFSPGLLSLLTQSGSDEAAQPDTTARQPLPGQDASIAIRENAPPTLELLLDVELPVSVSFGRANLPLKDVIKLTSGAIVELNRAVSEPVEVIVNNCVIARGEVVVIEGNYGVRIDEIVSRQERLRVLK